MTTAERVGIVGLGLIGGSLALRLRSQGISVLGIVRSLNKFQDIDFEVSTDWCDLSSCSIVFICTPLRDTLQMLKALTPHFAAGAIVSDVGSVKGFICREAKESLMDCRFIGGHPMAGTDKSGFENADSNLFVERKWVLTEQCEGLERIIALTGAKIIHTDAESHDRAVALISHLPLLLSLGLKDFVENYAQEDIRSLALELAATGYESMTRLANGNIVLNEDLLNLNRSFISDSFALCLKQIKKILEAS